MLYERKVPMMAKSFAVGMRVEPVSYTHLDVYKRQRLMAIFQDYANLEKVMSIRSCRHYYVHWALEFDAIYAHYGQAKYAVEILSQDYVNNLSGLDGGVEKVMYKMCIRDSIWRESELYF